MIINRIVDDYLVPRPCRVHSRRRCSLGLGKRACLEPSTLPRALSDPVLSRATQFEKDGKLLMAPRPHGLFPAVGLRRDAGAGTLVRESAPV
jgi:hypothetical protein